MEITSLKNLYNKLVELDNQKRLLKEKKSIYDQILKATDKLKNTYTQEQLEEEFKIDNYKATLDSGKKEYAKTKKELELEKKKILKFGTYSVELLGKALAILASYIEGEDYEYTIEEIKYTIEEIKIEGKGYNGIDVFAVIEQASLNSKDKKIILIKSRVPEKEDLDRPYISKLKLSECFVEIFAGSVFAKDYDISIDWPKYMTDFVLALTEYKINHNMPKIGEKEIIEFLKYFIENNAQEYINEREKKEENVKRKILAKING